MPLVPASGIALSPEVLLLITTSGLFSRPLLILLCCLVSKALPRAGAPSQLGLTSGALHALPSLSSGENKARGDKSRFDQDVRGGSGFLFG